MQRELDGFDDRRIRLVTRHGEIEGQLRTNSNISTLHYLNVAAMSQTFIVMHPPIAPSEGWNVAEGPLALSIETVLFAREISDYTPVPGDPIAAAEYERRAVRLNVDEYAVEGFLHLPPGANPIARLNQDPHAFFALSAVSVMGPDVEFAAPFLAIKRSAVLAIQTIGIGVGADETTESEMTTTC